jgi:hypothetical protein
MKIVRFLPQVLLISLLLALAGIVGLGLAQAPELPEERQPHGVVSIDAVVNSEISYQGVLKESGSPVTGNRDMKFRAYSDETCTTQVGNEIVKNDVKIVEGLFSVELNVNQNNFNGQGLWMEVEVGGTKIGCQEILPVPYALSLRPGARIEGPPGSVHLAFSSGIPSEGHGILAKGDDYGVVGIGKKAAIYGEGDVKQNLTGNGLVKAAVSVNCQDSSVLACTRSFNNVTTDTITCSPGPGDGRCYIDFGFVLTERYWVATANGQSKFGATCFIDDTKKDQLNCGRWDYLGNYKDGPIMVLVY